MPRVIRVDDADDDTTHPGDPGPNRMIDHGGNVWADDDSGGGDSGAVAAAIAGASAGSTGAEGVDIVSEYETAVSSGGDPFSNETGGEEGGGVFQTGPGAVRDPSIQGDVGTNTGYDGAGFSPDGTQFNNFEPIPNDEYINWNGKDSRVDPRIAEVARAISRTIGQPVTITSGFRSAAYNANLQGAAQGSRHLYGQALDINMGNWGDEAGRTRALEAAIAKLDSYGGIGGVGIYNDSGNNFTHFDVYRRRTWRDQPSWARSVMEASGRW